MQEETFYYVGLDISTKCCGISIFNQDKKLVLLTHVNPKVEEKLYTNDEYILYEKKRVVVNYLENKFADYNIKKVFIESPLMASNNQFTVVKLAKFNTLISNYLYEKGYEVQHVTEHEARKKFFPEFVTEKKVKGEIQRVLSFPKDVDKKEIVWNKVATLEPFVEWVRDTKGKLKVENFDMADSYVVACAGMDKKMK
jgi:Holliday junction resolvasome RuvABC endonuclease subunit